MPFIKHHLLSIVGICISIASLIWLARQVNFVELADALLHIEFWLLAPIPFLALLSFGLRAQRWRLLVEHQPSVRFSGSFSALMIGYLLNNLLPARAGDVARALELARSEQISRTKVFATLLTEKTIDLVTTLILLAAVLITYPALPDWIKRASLSITIVAFFALALLILAHVTGRHWIPKVVSIVTNWLPDNVAVKIEQMVFSALEGIAGMFRPSNAISFLFLTGFIWIVEVLIVYIVAVSVGLPLALGNALLVLLVLAIGSMVPSSPGQVGTFEIVGLAALALVSLQGSLAFAFIILLHLITLISSTTIGVVCMLVRKNPPLFPKSMPSP